MATTHEIPRIDVMVAYSCNLECRGCISISDRPRGGIEPFDNLVRDIRAWGTRLQPKLVTVFGGEPCLHPKLQDICRELRNTWPHSRLRLITNGYFLDHFDPNFWFTLGDFEIQVSEHRADHAEVLRKQIAGILDMRHPWKISQHGGSQHKQIAWQHGNLCIYRSIFGEFVVPYRQDETALMPWFSNAADAHAICGSPDSPVLYKGRLYKCPAVANFQDITNQKWFGYRGLEVDQNLDEFVSLINHPEPCCGQCPDNKQAVRINL